MRLITKKYYQQTLENQIWGKGPLGRPTILDILGWLRKNAMQANDGEFTKHLSGCIYNLGIVHTTKTGEQS